MLEEGRSCLEITQQLQAVEKAIGNAKKTLVHDHIDHCLGSAAHEESGNVDDAIDELREITKYL
ncbi:metal-sensing transcriptional repressor [Sulfuriferula nivalis]